jgi:hypothetical protein
MPGPFAYLNNIPQPTDQLSVSQGQLLTNAASIKSLIDIDHVDFASVDAGKHNKVTFPVQAVTPTFQATEFGIWNELDPITLTNQIWLNNPTIAQQVPWAQSNFNSIGTTNIRNGYFYLPCGFLVKFGTIAPVASGNAAYALPTVDSGAVGIPAFDTKIVFVAAWPVVVGGVQSISANVQGASLTTISISNQGTNNITCSFIAIGI